MQKFFIKGVNFHLLIAHLKGNKSSFFLYFSELKSIKQAEARNKMSKGHPRL